MKFAVKILKWIPAAFITAVSWHLSDLEKIEQMPSFAGADKIVHGICFAGLAFWVSFACGTRSIARIWIPAALTAAYGIIDEIHQHYTPGRSCSFFDWTADAAGAVLGSLCFAACAYAASEICAHRKQLKETAKN